jgi:hypothetical protein
VDSVCEFVMEAQIMLLLQFTRVQAEALHELQSRLQHTADENIEHLRAEMLAERERIVTVNRLLLAGWPPVDDLIGRSCVRVCSGDGLGFSIRCFRLCEPSGSSFPQLTLCAQALQRKQAATEERAAEEIARITADGAVPMGRAVHLSDVVFCYLHAKAFLCF